MLRNQIENIVSVGKFLWSIWIQCMTLQKIEMMAKNMTHSIHSKIVKFIY